VVEACAVQPASWKLQSAILFVALKYFSYEGLTTRLELFYD
jgi:hypothetical protein